MVDAELLNAVVIVLALVVIAGLAVLFVARYFSLRSSVSMRIGGHSQKPRGEG